jgi:hypothetical protein
MQHGLGAMWNRIVQYLLMAFTAGSIVAWFVVNQGRFLLPLSIFDKTIEALLIIALWLHLRSICHPATRIPRTQTSVIRWSIYSTARRAATTIGFTPEARTRLPMH